MSRPILLLALALSFPLHAARTFADEGATPAAVVDESAAAEGISADGGVIEGDEIPLTPEELAAIERDNQLIASLHPRTGVISLASGKFQINLPAHLSYLDPGDTARVLEAWGNPPGARTEGLVYPSDIGLLADDTYAVVLSYEHDGHVDDEDAAELDFGELLQEMQASAREDNTARTQAGVATVTLRGWAERPHYDRGAHVLYWAKDLLFADSDSGTLNYAVRVLGREGVFEMNAVMDLAGLPEAREVMRELMPVATFTRGNRYADYDASTDQLAEYGVAALIAGGVAQKAGFFKLLLGALVAGKKFVIIALVAIGAFVKRLFGAKDSTDQA